jgi:hypothetical protein
LPKSSSEQRAVSCARLLGSTASPLLRHARALLELERTVVQLLPTDLAAHCRVMNVRGGVLILAAPSSAWAARLRFAAADLANQLCRLPSSDVREVRVRIQPEVGLPRAAARPTPRLSMESAELLARTALTIEHQDLREALYRLAANVREN